MMALQGLYTALHPEIFRHGMEEEPREACGLILDDREYVRCRNITRDDGHFVLHPGDYAAAAARGTVTAVVHTHPRGMPATPSLADLACCERTGLPWLIMSIPSGQVQRVDPQGRVLPLLGRPYVHGVFDCLTLAKDFFRQEFGIVLPDIEYAEEWWRRGQDLISELYAEWGFEPLTVPHATLLLRGDVMLMQTPPSRVFNHIAVYLGGGRLLHQPRGRLSCEIPYDGSITQHANRWLRYRGRP
jgi:proteasome lid subunit RPN8/RPN11